MGMHWDVEVSSMYSRCSHLLDMSSQFHALAPEESHSSACWTTGGWLGPRANQDLMM
jgi:hypothetical protein